MDFEEFGDIGEIDNNTDFVKQDMVEDTTLCDHQRTENTMEKRKYVGNLC